MTRGRMIQEHPPFPEYHTLSYAKASFLGTCGAHAMHCAILPMRVMDFPKDCSLGKERALRVDFLMLRENTKPGSAGSLCKVLSAMLKWSKTMGSGLLCPACMGAEFWLCRSPKIQGCMEAPGHLPSTAPLTFP